MRTMSAQLAPILDSAPTLGKDKHFGKIRRGGSRVASILPPRP